MKIILAYLSIILIWSTTPLAISWSTVEVGASFAVASRMLLGGIVALLLLIMTRIHYALSKRALMAYLISGLGIYLAMEATYLGALYLPSGWLSVIYGFSPVLTGFFAHFLLNEKITHQRILGLILSIFGLCCIFWQGLITSENMVLGFFF